jgi:hypothetical protein
MPSFPDQDYEASSRNSAGGTLLAAPPLVIAEEPPGRPHCVDAAVAFMVITSGIGMVIAAAALGSLQHFNATFPAEAAPIGATDEFVGQVQTVVRVSLALVGAIALILAINQAALASGIVRGNRGARIGVWTLSAAGVACAMLTLFAMVIAHSAAPLDSADPVGAAVVQAAQDSLPGWAPGMIGVLALLQALGYVAAAILLAAPSADGFFERVLRPWRPP